MRRKYCQSCLETTVQLVNIAYTCTLYHSPRRKYSCYISIVSNVQCTATLSISQSLVSSVRHEQSDD